MIKQEILKRNGIPGRKMTNSFILTSMHLGNIWVSTMKQVLFYVVQL